MSHVISQIWLLVCKDMRIEFRSKAAISLVIVMGILVVVVLGLGLGSQQLTSSMSAPAILWVAYLFGGVMVFEKTMNNERHDGALAALLLAPVDRTLIYISKLISNLVLMMSMAVVITPAAIVFFHFDLSAAPLEFVLIMGISMIGFAAIGTLFSAVISSSQLQGGLLAIAVFPICLPLVTYSTHLLLKVFKDVSAFDLMGIMPLVGAAVIYLVFSWLVFELILEP